MLFPQCQPLAGQPQGPCKDTPYLSCPATPHHPCPYNTTTPICARTQASCAGCQRSSAFEERFVTCFYCMVQEYRVRLRDNENQLTRVKMECRYPPQILLRA